MAITVFLALLSSFHIIAHTLGANQTNEMPKKTSGIVPLGNRVLIDPVTIDQKTASGIILPDSARQEKPEQGKVVAVGEGKFQDGALTPMTVKKGDTVVFSKYGYDEIKIDEKEYYIIEEDKILGIVK